MSGKRAAVLLAPGFEEIEAVSVIDVLRRAGIETVVAAVDGSTAVTGSHLIQITVDQPLAAVRADELDAVVLPGGMPGSTHLAASAGVISLVTGVRARGGLVAAICAAPMVLQRAGLLTGKKVTAFPQYKDQLAGADYTGQPVEFDDGILTGKGAGVAVEFALELVRRLGLPEKAGQLQAAMQMH